MDLRVYYQKLRAIEQEIHEAHVVVISHETPEGGRAGQMSEVSRSVAAKLVLEGRAHAANPEQTAEFRNRVAQARKEAEERAMAQRIQVNLISEADLKAAKSNLTPARPEKH